MRVSAGRPAADSMLHEVMAGLSQAQKEIPPKYFYDARGSRLFEAITELPEYYLTRTERALLEHWIPGWFAELAPAALVELGPGGAGKTRILLDHMVPARLYAPLDVSADFLQGTARALRAEYPDLVVAPRVADFASALDLGDVFPRPTVFAFLGSTIGNFTPPAATRLLTEIREAMRPGDVFLLGADLRPGPAKSVETLEAAYNDAQGVTAEFNLNLLEVINRELGADFDLGGFEHRAFYAPEQSRIEMHLVSRRDQVVEIPEGGSVVLEESESIRTEISCKYEREMVEQLFARAGLCVRRWQEDPSGLYAVTLGEAC